MNQLFIAIFGLTAITLAMGKDQHLHKWAPVVGLAGQPFWGWFAYQSGGWGLGLLVAAYTLVYLRAISVHWSVPKPAPAPVVGGKKTRVYLAGPMSNLPDFNYPAFHREAALHRSNGFHVENPAENPAPACKSWHGYMRLAIPQLLSCETVAMLPGWERSKGARIEHNLAVGMGLRVIYLPKQRPWLAGSAA